MTREPQRVAGPDGTTSPAGPPEDHQRHGDELDHRQAGERIDVALSKVTACLPGGGEDRPGQQDMARRVGVALDQRRHLVVQAGTGTGKSLAYLVPIAQQDRPVVVATVTKALQDQLAERELPLIAEALGDELSFAVLKGRSNYLCRQRLTELEGRGFQAELGDAVEGFGDADDHDRRARSHDPGPSPSGLVDEVRRLLGWSNHTPSGDRAELDFEPSPRAWGMVSVGPRECPGAFHCPSGPHCFAEAAHDAASHADVVVVNTHLYAAHVASQEALLPEHDTVVFDEAHELEEVMTAGLGVEVTPGRLRALVALAKPLLSDDTSSGSASSVADRLVETADELVLKLADHVGQRVSASPSAAGAEVAGVLRQMAERVRQLLDQLRRDARQSADGGGADQEADADRRARAQRAVTSASHLLDDIDHVLEDDEDIVVWVDGSRRAPVLRASPIDVAPLLRPLFEHTTAVLTSATIPPGLGERVGLDGRACDVVDVGSPFDYRHHALLYVARHLPDRRRPESEAALFEELGSLIEAAGGRTLALFTSHRALTAASAALGPRLAALELHLWKQGDLPKGRLVRAFADDETSCLFATMGFWQGIDVPGPSLSLVALDRLPFPRPDEPVLQARRDRAGAAAFAAVDLPRAATMLAQGSGRLIRTTTDRGVVAVLDPRLATASYRATLLSAMPPLRRTVDPGEVAWFLKQPAPEVE